MCLSGVVNVTSIRKQRDPKAPIQPIPIITKPFEKIAFDLVGPLTGSVEILSMCWPGN